MQESPGLKPDWIHFIKVIFNEKRKHFVIQQPFKDFPAYQKNGNWSIVLY